MIFSRFFNHKILLSSLLLSCSGAVVADTAAAQQQFFQQLSTLCGKAFAGKVVKGNASDDKMRSQQLLMHVRECSDTEIKVPFHVGEDRSRTWVITKTDTGLRLKHDHRHKDGSSDKVTMYGGDTASMGTSQKQSFPIDQASIDNFMQNGLTQSVTNVWHIEVTPNTFSYLLTREARHFQVDFDLTQPQPFPPVPWGHE